MPTSFVCDICGQVLKTQASLNKHEKTNKKCISMAQKKEQDFEQSLREEQSLKEELSLEQSLKEELGLEQDSKKEPNKQDSKKQKKSPKPSYQTRKDNIDTNSVKPVPQQNENAGQSSRRSITSEKIRLVTESQYVDKFAELLKLRSEQCGEESISFPPEAVVYTMLCPASLMIMFERFVDAIGWDTLFKHVKKNKENIQVLADDFIVPLLNTVHRLQINDGDLRSKVQEMQKKEQKTEQEEQGGNEKIILDAFLSE
jgi:hypothetical protein